MRSIAAIVLVLAAAGGAAFFWYRPAAAPAASGALDFTLTTLSQAVAAAAPGSELRDIPDTAAVGGGWRIETSRDGRALLESPDETLVTLDQNTELTVVAHDADARRSKFSLAGGRAWTRVKKLFDQDELYEIRSSNAVATVRGTSFSFGYAAGVTTLLVAEGIVGILALDPETGQPLTASSTLVHAGQKAIVDDRLPPSERIRVAALTTEDMESEWYRFNDPDGSPAPAPAPPPAPAPAPTPMPAPAPTPEPSPAPAPLPAPNPPPPPAPLAIDAVAPDTVTYNPSGANAVQIAGSGFSGATAVLVGVLAVKFEIKDDGAIWLFADSSISPGTYAVSVRRGSEEAKRDRALTILPQPDRSDESGANPNQDPPPGSAATN
ncbi:hypothetical protein C4552_03970 [Candidatus Parcubacteria bacterium]|nr:MAG: hypothetical protein C4552_03970 [Candidatus Parcubacteria bacterium]